MNNNVKKVINSFGILLAVFAAFWIVTGSTIAFHQVHVYHNHVDLWQVQSSHSSGKDFKKLIRFLDNNYDSTLSSDLVDQCRINEFGQVALNLSKKTIYSRYLFDLITSEYNYDKILRGPPSA